MFTQLWFASLSDVCFRCESLYIDWYLLKGGIYCCSLAHRTFIMFCLMFACTSRLFNTVYLYIRLYPLIVWLHSTLFTVAFFMCLPLTNFCLPFAFSYCCLLAMRIYLMLFPCLLHFSNRRPAYIYCGLLKFHRTMTKLLIKGVWFLEKFFWFKVFFTCCKILEQRGYTFLSF